MSSLQIYIFAECKYNWKYMIWYLYKKTSHWYLTLSISWLLLLSYMFLKVDFLCICKQDLEPPTVRYLSCLGFCLLEFFFPSNLLNHLFAPPSASGVAIILFVVFSCFCCFFIPELSVIVTSLHLISKNCYF